MILQENNTKNQPVLSGIISVGLGIAVGIIILSIPNPLFLFAVPVGILAVLFLFKHPELGLLFTVFMIYTKLSFVLINFHGVPSIGKPITLLMLLITLMRWIVYKEKLENFTTATLILGTYFILGFSALSYATDPSYVREELEMFVKDAIIMYIIISQIKNAAILRRVIWVLLSAGIFLGTISCYQYFTDTYDNNYWGFGQAVLANLVSDTAEAGYRIGGPGYGPTYYAVYLIFLTPLALDRLWSEKKNSLRLIAGWAYFVTVLALYLTFCRSAFIGFVASMVTMFIRRPPKFSVMVLTFIFMSISTLYLPAQFTERLLELEKLIPGKASQTEIAADVSLKGRMSENISAIQMFEDHPFHGVGLGQYEVHYQTYAQRLGLDGRRGERAAHSIFLETMAEMGILGLFWVITMQLLTLAGLEQAKKKFRAASKPEEAFICFAMEAGIIGFLVASTFNHLSHPRTFWLMYGIALSIPNIAEKELLAASSSKRKKLTLKKSCQLKSNSSLPS